MGKIREEREAISEMRTGISTASHKRPAFELPLEGPVEEKKSLWGNVEGNDVDKAWKKMHESNLVETDNLKVYIVKPATRHPQ